MSLDTESQSVQKWLFTIFESDNIVMAVRCVNSSDNQFSLMSDILSCYASTLVWAFVVVVEVSRLRCGSFCGIICDLLAKRRRLSRTKSWEVTSVLGMVTMWDITLHGRQRFNMCF
jgi:hypothetical protein